MDNKIIIKCSVAYFIATLIFCVGSGLSYTQHTVDYCDIHYQIKIKEYYLAEMISYIITLFMLLMIFIIFCFTQPKQNLLNDHKLCMRLDIILYIIINIIISNLSLSIIGFIILINSTECFKKSNEIYNLIISLIINIINLTLMIYIIIILKLSKKQQNTNYQQLV